ncbi:ClpP/crotonase-like domain-containing protein [Aspergillus pseudoustus]|uniref:ClpP/crotonase-like domain-containing protein n=1 Tax=Aspergillus pseudoustus TaxID=1810923 RepID=A0ABR4KEP7_9EURO
MSPEGILVLKYNRPEVGNATNYVMMKDLLRALHWAIEESTVKIIVQTGQGKFFSTGMDLSSPQWEDDALQVLYEINKLMINCPKITIAAVNGPGVGYGASSIALFDLVYMVSDAYFFTPFVKWGLCAEACSSFTFPSILGRQRASHMILAGGRITAKELELAGLVSKLIPRQNFWQNVLDMAVSLARQPQEVLAANKRLLSVFWKQKLLDANEQELRVFKELLQTSSARAREGRFAEERASRKMNSKGTDQSL